MSDHPAETTTRRIEPGGVARGTVQVPGSKSIAQRALIIAALAEGESSLVGVPENEDLSRLLDALRALGVELRQEGDRVWVVGVGSRGFTPGDITVDVGENGTALRCLIALAATRADRTRICGPAHRPLAPLLGALRELGATVEGDATPVDIRGPISGGRVSVASELSSQFATALLLIAPSLPEGLDLETPGLVSTPYLEMTARLLREFGADVLGAGSRWQVSPGGCRGRELHIEPDASSAAFALAAAAVTGGEVTIAGSRRDSIQGDARFAEILEAMGCADVGGGGTIGIRGGSLRGIDIDLSGTPDLAPPLAAVAPFAGGTTRIRGVAHLRHKESDRLATLERGLRALGVGAHHDGESLTIPGGATLSGATLDPAGDHRMAMAFAVIGLRVPGVVIEDPGCVAKSDPGFWERLDRLIDRSIDVIGANETGAVRDLDG